jgi:hypothetical protein
MAIWEAATLQGNDPGDRVDVDSEGAAWVKILSPSFRLTDETGDHTFIGWGNKVIPSEE